MDEYILDLAQQMLLDFDGYHTVRIVTDDLYKQYKGLYPEINIGEHLQPFEIAGHPAGGSAEFVLVTNRATAEERHQ